MRRRLRVLLLGAAAAALFLPTAAHAAPVPAKQARAFAAELVEDFSMDRFDQHCAALAPAFRVRTFGDRAIGTCVDHWEANTRRGVRLNWHVTGVQRRRDGSVTVRVFIDGGAWLITVGRSRGRLLAYDIRSEA